MIRIETQPALIGWDTQRGRLDQSGNGQWVLDIESRAPELQMETTDSQVQIDQSAQFEEAGLKGIKAFMDDAVAYGQQIISQGIDRIVSQGNEFKDIHTGVDPIPSQAIYNAFDMFNNKEFNYALIPSSRPRIDVIEGRVDFQYQKGEVINRTVPQKVDMQYSPWRIDYYMQQYASISMQYEPSNFNTTL